jgi:exosortase A
MSAVTTDESTPTMRWRTSLAAFVALLLAVGLLFRETATVMVGIWERSETFAHAYLVLPISLWLVWRQRARLAALTPRAQPWILLAMLAVAIAWMLADLVVVNAASQYTMVALLILTVPAVLGLEVALTILFPLLYLFFMVPFGEFMVPTLMEWTADFTVAALKASGIPVLRDGQHFVIPSGSWSVVDECSGVRYLMASFTVGALYAYLNYRSYARRTLFMLFSLAVPIVANWLRAYLIVMVAHLSDNQIAAGVDHIIYGWVFFGIVIFVMFMIGARWAEHDEPTAAVGASGQDAGVGVSSRTIIATAVAGIAIVALPHVVIAVLERAEGAAAPPQLQLPMQLSPAWTGDGGGPFAWTPEFANPSTQASRVYGAAAGSVGMHVAYVRGQTDQRKLVTSQHLLVGTRDSMWAIPIGGGQHSVSVGDRTVSVRTTELVSRDITAGTPRTRVTVWRVYWIDGRFVAGDVQAKLASAAARLRGHGDEGALLMLYADAASPETATATLTAFVQANLDSLDTLLRQTRDRR